MKLHLYMTNLRYQPPIKDMLQQLVFSPLYIDFQQVNFSDIQIRHNLSKRAYTYNSSSGF